MNTIAELRVLVFSFNDIKKALELSAQQLNISVPDKDITEVIGADGEEVTILFQNSPGIHEPGLDIQEHDMIESLIGLCISRKIPIPRNAEKTIEVQRNTISMWIETGDVDNTDATEQARKRI
ncbi:MAG: hypothetical protein ACRBBN_04425 [Methyloligellaceae bacterium]